MTALDRVDLTLGPGFHRHLRSFGEQQDQPDSILGAMIRPTPRGSVMVEDRDITEACAPPAISLPARKDRLHLPVVSPDAGAQCRRNICLSLEIRRFDNRQRALDALDIVSLAAKRIRPDQMSHGEKQRVAVARAIAHKPMIVLADEPTASLDAANGAQVTQLLADIARDNERIVAVVTTTRGYCRPPSASFDWKMAA
jgi:putative ABC transport system ATP-binding protein